MKILIAPDSFKDCLSSIEIARAIHAGIIKVIPKARCYRVPFSDGGDGLIDSILHSRKGRKIYTQVVDPLYREIQSYFVMIDKKTAIIEMAKASGLELLKKPERDPANTSSFGTGQLILSALDHGAETILLGLGGSATNDGGAGLLSALGTRFFNSPGEMVIPTGGNLRSITRIDFSRLDKRLIQNKIIIASDVRNRLLGPEGATMVFGSQKGANSQSLKKLEKNLIHFGELLEKESGKKIVKARGTGAAGGLAAGLMAITTNLKIKSGFSVVAELVDVEDKIKNADIIITAEGRLDGQTFYGKVPYGLARLAKKYKKPVLTISGAVENDFLHKKNKSGIIEIPIQNKPSTLEYSMNEASGLITIAVIRALRLITAGQQI